MILVVEVTAVAQMAVHKLPLKRLNNLQVNKMGPKIVIWRKRPMLR